MSDKPDTKGLQGIDDNYIVDAIIGIGVTLLLIFMSSITAIVGAIGIPYFPESIAGAVGRFLIIVVSAPIFEELFFREICLDFFAYKFTNFGYLFGALASSVLFSLFHLTAYGGSLASAGGSFISVFIAGMIFAYIRKSTKSNIGNIFCHASFNFWMFTKLVVAIG